MKVSAVIPAYNEAKRIAQVVEEALPHVDEVLVVDDGSTDDTPEEAKRSGAIVVLNRLAKGYIGALKTGLRTAKGEVIVTLDADGEHNPREIPRLVEPILQGQADLVLGQRDAVARPSERLLSWLARRCVNVRDSGTGFRALTRDLALQLKLSGRCTCGTLVLEAAYRGARVVEVPISLRATLKPRGVAWFHLPQLFYVLGWLWKLQRSRACSKTSLSV